MLEKLRTGWASTAVSPRSLRPLPAAPLWAALGFLTVWWPQGSQTAHMEAQDPSWSIPASKVQVASPFLTSPQKSHGVTSTISAFFCLQVSFKPTQTQGWEHRPHLSVERMSRSYNRVTCEVQAILTDIFEKYNLPYTASGRARIWIRYT